MALPPGPDGVQEAYTTYAAQGGDGADNWAARAKTWGYAPAVLESLGLEGAEDEGPPHLAPQHEEREATRRWIVKCRCA